MTDNYYDILGVDKNSTADEIKKRYRELAKTHHPDLHPSTETENKMKEINKAYSILGDPQKRAEYDNPNLSFENFFRVNPFDIFGGNFKQARFEYTQTIRIPFYDLILGVDLEFKFPDGASIKFTIPKFSQNLSTVSVNKGNKYYNLKLVAVLPSSLDENKLELVRKLKDGNS